MSCAYVPVSQALAITAGIPLQFATQEAREATADILAQHPGKQEIQPIG